MKDLLDLYAEAPDPKWPVLCFDESPVQLIGEVRQPIPAEPGQFERTITSTAATALSLSVHEPRRKVKVTERRAAQDYAQCTRELVDVQIPMPPASGSCRTTCRPTRQAPSMRHSRPPKPGEF